MKIENPEQFDRILRAIGNEFVHAKIHYKMFIELNESFTDFNREVQLSPVFWGLTRDSLRECSILGLCRAYDQDKRTNSLPNLLKLIAKDPDFAKKVGNSNAFGSKPELASIDRQQLSKDVDFTRPKNPPLKRLTNWRNKMFAHRNSEIIGNNNPLSTGEVPKYGDLEILLDNGLDIVNRYAYLFRQTKHSATLVGQDDFKFVLICVRECQKIRDAELKAKAKKHGIKDDFFL